MDRNLSNYSHRTGRVGNLLARPLSLTLGFAACGADSPQSKRP